MRISDWSSDVCSSDLIALRDGQARRVIADFAQARDHVAIDFDYLQLPEFFEQRHRQRAKAGTDFDDDLPRLRMDGANDACDHLRIVQKVLAETFLGLVFGFVHGQASWIARCSAARRLPASALPLPARDRKSTRL